MWWRHNELSVPHPSPASHISAVTSPGTSGQTVLTLHVGGMDCAEEAGLIRRALDRPGVGALSFDLVGRRVDVAYDPAAVTVDAILDAVASTGLTAHTHGPGEVVGDDHSRGARDHQAARWWAMASSVILVGGWGIDAWSAGTWTGWLAGVASPSGGTAAAGLGHSASVAAYAVSGLLALRPMAPRALASLRYLRLDMHVLVCLSAFGAAAIGQWAEGAAVACLFALAHLMEAWSIERARSAVAELVGHEPGWGDEGRHESAPVERWIERFAAVYTPVVTFSALAVTLLPPIIDGHWSTWFYRGLIFLVLACPCALVISTPVTVVAAVTSAARRHVLIKGGAPLERAAHAREGTIEALSQAGVTVARRSQTTGARLESADVVMMGDDDADVRLLVSHARRALRVIRQNVALALSTKAAFLVSALLGAAPLWLAVLADTGATVVVTLNGLRLLRALPPPPAEASSNVR